VIKNNFNNPRKYIISFPENYRKYSKLIQLKWFRIQEGKTDVLIPLKDEDQYIEFNLKPSESVSIMVHITRVPETELKERIVLPFEILVESKIKKGIRKHRLMNILHEYAPIAGITIKIEDGNAVVEGIVKDPNGKPLPGVKVVIRTTNGLQGSEAVTDKNGKYSFNNINPDVYLVKAETGRLHIKDQMVILGHKDVHNLNLKFKDK
jgi:hypothetical protein